MWYCTECGTKNEDNSNFCYECGNSKGQDLQEGSQASIAEKGVKKSSKHNSKLFRVSVIAIVIVALLGTVAFGAKDFIIRKFALNDPVKRIAYGYKKISDARTLDNTTKLSFEFTEYPKNPESKMLVNLVNDFSIIVNSKLDKKSERFLQTIDFVLDDDTLLDASLYGDSETIAFSMPLLIDEWVYIELNQLSNMLEDMDIDNKLDTFEYKDYEKIFDLSHIKNWKDIQNDYIDFISKELVKYVDEEGKKVDVFIHNGDEESTIKCEEIVIKMSFEDIVDFCEELFSEIEDDDRLKALITQKVQQFFDIAVENGDIDDMDIEEDDIEEIMDDFDDFYDDSFKEILDSFAEIKDELKYSESDFEFTWSFKIDSANNLRSINYICEVNSIYYDYYEGNIDIDFNIQGELVFNSINKRLDFERPNFTNGYNFSEDPEKTFYDIGYDFGDNMEHLIESKEFEPILELLQTINPYYFN